MALKSENKVIKVEISPEKKEEKNFKEALKTAKEFHKFPRKSFAKREEILPPPDLLEFVFDSYERFLQLNKNPHERENVGLEAVFRNTFPVSDISGDIEIRYKGYEIGDWYCKCGKYHGLGGKGVVCEKCGHEVVFRPKKDPNECKEKDLTFGAPLRVLLECIAWQKDPNTGEKIAPVIKEEKIYFGEIPLVTPRGSFIIDGTEKAIVNQLHRSPGVYFKSDISKSSGVARQVDVASIIPADGSWIEFELPQTDILYAKIDRKRRFYGTYLLRAFGIATDEEILSLFHKDDIFEIKVKDKKFYVIENGEERELSSEELKFYIPIEDIIDPETGEIVQKAYEDLSPKKIPEGITFRAVRYDRKPYGRVILNTLRKEKNDREKDGIEDPVVAAYIEIFRKIRPGDSTTIEGAKKLFENMFLNPKNYDLGRVGRAKLNEKLYPREKLEKLTLSDLSQIEWLPPLLLAEDIYDKEGNIVLEKGTLITKEVAKKLLEVCKDTKKESIKVEPDYDSVGRILSKADIIATIRYLLNVHAGLTPYDDIDHLANRRVRGVGELAEVFFKKGMKRFERHLKEKLTALKPEKPEAINLKDLIQAKGALNDLIDFFKLNQLSQFLDQTNPLSETTHKRRLSALGPGGISREHATFEVRDVHPSHYGRICPIETPEGQNIGLVVSPTTYARINWLGFLETPYRKVENRYVTNEVRYMQADEEEKYIIAQASVPVDSNGRIAADTVMARHKGEFKLVSADEVNYMDVSPKQVFSVSSSLIPFLEHDDANRALMGSNMQRQAVPLITTDSPIVGTGMEGHVAKYSRWAVTAKRSGVVEHVSSDKIIIRADEGEKAESDIDTGFDVYHLLKFQKSNQKTCINQKPIVKKGQRVEKGQVIADGHSMQEGELALGKNILVAFMPWRGYNFEDAILVSERLLKDDVYTSIHIEEVETQVIETKLGKEEITKDIPNVPEEKLKHLDESGIVTIGTYVKPGDILVGKVAPKAEEVLTPEEKLLQAIFGEKAKSVKNVSLKCPHGVEGVVIDVKIISRKGESKDIRSKLLEQEERKKLEKAKQEELSLIRKERDRKVIKLITGKTLAQNVEIKGELIAKAGEKITKELAEKIVLEVIKKPSLIADEETAKEIKKIRLKAIDQMALIENIYQEKKEALERGHDLPAGVNKIIKIYIAQKRKLTVGDKMAGRHGNKGVISRIAPVEDMPFMEDGTPVDMVLNPLGVPSRMNVGQLFETMLGYAGKKLGEKIENLIKVGLDAVRKELKSIYCIHEGKKENCKCYMCKLIDSLSDEEIKVIAKRLGKEGVKFETPIFNGATEEEVKKMLKKAGLPETSRVKLYDGLTGEPFDQDVTVGYMYMLKLIHMAADKIHARSTGPYSLITQQPLGGRSHFGGQRFGEMEVWALEAYGAAYTLQEMLTVKSDDVEGRNKVYQAITKGIYTFEPSLPESFNVLVRELKGLCLDVAFIKELDESESKEKKVSNIFEEKREKPLTPEDLFKKEESSGNKEDNKNSSDN